MKKHKHDQIKKQYDEKGFVFPLQVLDPEELLYFQKEYNNHVLALKGDLNPNRFKQLHLHFPWAYQLATHPSIISYIKQILGENVLVHGSSVFAKQPGDNTFISWHQDGYYMKLQSLDYMSAWIALSDSTTASGCMRVIPNTHLNLMPHTENRNELNLLSSGLTLKGSINEANAVDIELKAGQMSIHHVNLVHGSNPNKSDHERVGFAVRYISAEYTQTLEHHEVLLASGVYNKSHFNLLKIPPKGTISESIKNQKNAHDKYRIKRGFKK